MTRRHLLKSLLLLPFLPAVKLLPKPTAPLGSYENPVPCKVVVRTWFWKFQSTSTGANATAFLNHEPTQDDRNALFGAISPNLRITNWYVETGPLEFYSTTECCRIVSPWRVDAEQMTGVTVGGQPGRTRYQKQTDEALRIDRPTVWEG